jgi:hypothetical protein
MLRAIQRVALLFSVLPFIWSPALRAQTAAPAPPAAASPSDPKADDAPSFRVGAMLFADYTFQSAPRTADGDGNVIRASSFNVSRAYLNLTGKLNHWILFRITPEATRETGSGSSLNGSQTFRLKFAYAQFNLDDWAPKGTWARFGIQQTPLIEYEETIYRYRFQGPVFSDREGYVIPSDGGISGHMNFPGEYGDVHAGIYNGDGFNRVEPNNEKAVEIRASVRPFAGVPLWKGIRVTGYMDADHYVQSATRRRLVGLVTLESDRVNAGFDYVSAGDRTSVKTREVSGKGWSLWATPRLVNGWELLLRHDDMKPDDVSRQHRTRNIAGLAYWIPNLQKVSSSVMLDYDSLQQSGYVPVRPRDTRYGLKLLVQF